MIVTLPILTLQSAAAAAERLSDLGYNAASVTFTHNSFTVTGVYFNDEAASFTLSVSEETDDVGTVSAICEFMSARHDGPRRFSAGSDDLVTAVYLAIDDHL